MKKSLYATVALISAALISYQVILMYTLSIIQWHHFAYMIISAALLGFGAAGTLLSLLQNKKFTQSDSAIFLLLVFTSVMILISTALTSRPEMGFDSYLILSDKTHMLKIAFSYFVFFIPFLSGALVIAMLFKRYPRLTGKLYFFNLLGSAAGAAIPLLLINKITPEALIPAVSFIPLAAAIFAVFGKIRKPHLIVLLFAAGAGSVLLLYPPSFYRSQYKGISYASNQPGFEILEKIQSVHGLIEYARTPASRFAPGLSLSYRGDMPKADTVFLNGETLGPIFNQNRDYSIFRHTPKALPFRLRKIKNVLTLEPGTLYSAFFAETEGAVNITAAGPLAYDIDSLIKSRPGPDSSKFNLKNVDSRTFLFMADSKYDLITLPPANTFRGSAGLYSLREKYTLTLESFNRMMELLSSDGIIYIPVWTDYPPRASLKLLLTLTETFNAAGLDAREHIIAVRGWNTIHFIVSKNPFTEKEYNTVSNFCIDNIFDPALPGQLRKETEKSFHKIKDTNFFYYIDRIMAGRGEDLSRDYKFKISPATDNNPFFLNFMTLRSARHIIKTGGFRDFSFMELGYLLMIFTFIQVTAAAAVLVFLPALKLKKKLKFKFFSVIYFSSLGLGFISMEMLFIQKFAFYFGSPVYSAAFVIAFMLSAAGLGSYYSQKLNLTKRNIITISLLVFLTVIVYTLFLESALYGTIKLNPALKTLISFALIFPAGFLMGMPFPLGLGYIGRKNSSNIPWCWGIDGSLSVIGAVLASIISVNLGFLSLMLAVSLLYLAAAGAALTLK